MSDDTITAIAKVKFVRDLPEYGFRKNDILLIPVTEDDYNPDFMDEVCDIMVMLVAKEFERRCGHKIEHYPVMYYNTLDDIVFTDGFKDPFAKYGDNPRHPWEVSISYEIKHGSVYDKAAKTIDHSGNDLAQLTIPNTDIRYDFCFLNMYEVSEKLYSY